MKVCLLLMVMLMAMTLSSAVRDKQSSKSTRVAKSFQEREQMDEEEEEDDEDDAADADNDDDSDVEEKLTRKTGKDEHTERKNPCMAKKCRRGETCIVDRKYRAKCVCYSACPTALPGDDRYQVCSKLNVTYDSECALDRQHCLCRRRQEGCSDPQFKKIRLDYFGPCQELTPCSERELKEFPNRTRDWLYVIMKELVDRQELADYQALLGEEGQNSSSQAVLWKFCELDVAPYDKRVSRRELVYTIQTLKPLEHCLLPFLSSCDPDRDGHITLHEWGACLGLEKDEIRDVCKAVHKGNT